MHRVLRRRKNHSLFFASRRALNKTLRGTLTGLVDSLRTGSRGSAGSRAHFRAMQLYTNSVLEPRPDPRYPLDSVEPVEGPEGHTQCALPHRAPSRMARES